jgi:hypothetical protein
MLVHRGGVMVWVATVLLCFSLASVNAQAQSRTPTPQEQKRIDEYNEALSGDTPDTTGAVSKPNENRTEHKEDSSADIKTETPPEAAKTKSERKILAMLDYAPLDLFIPSKLGATAGWRFTPKTTAELEFVRGALSVPFLFDALGGMSDQRLSLVLRSHFGKSSFNYHYGVAYHMFKVKLGNEIINRAVPHASEYDEIVLNSVGFVVGIGNRWIIADNFIVGVDWGVWSQPLAQTTKKTEFTKYVSNADRESVNKAIDFISEFPRFSLLKINLGMTF